MNKETYLETRKRILKLIRDLDDDYVNQSIAVGKRVKTKPSYKGKEFGGTLSQKILINDGDIACFVRYIDELNTSHSFECSIDDIEEA